METVVARCSYRWVLVSFLQHFVPLFSLLDGTLQVILAHFEALTHADQPFKSTVKRDKCLVFDPVFVHLVLLREVIYLADAPDNHRILLVHTVSLLVNVQLQDCVQPVIVDHSQLILALENHSGC